MKHCSLQVELGYLNMQIVFKEAQRKRAAELLLLHMRYGDFFISLPRAGFSLGQE